MTGHVLVVDQGTTSTRSIVFGPDAALVAMAQEEFPQIFPQPGWVEHDPEEIWQSVCDVVRQALASAGPDHPIVAVGLTNQRETVVVWERTTGRTVAPAIVWQDRRTADFCRERHADEPWIRQRTGLVLDPYFSGTKLRWLLEQDAGLRHRAEAGQLAAGTIDSWLLWRLTAGATHATDVSNASRTLLLDLRTTQWDAELCRFFGVPAALLPEVRPSAADFGRTAGLTFLPDGVPITGAAGDQQAALFGQRGFAAGDAKCTYGTGAFFLLHLGDRPSPSKQRARTVS